MMQFLSDSTIAKRGSQDYELPGLCFFSPSPPKQNIRNALLSSFSSVLEIHLTQKTGMWIVEPEYELRSSTACVGNCPRVNSSGRHPYHSDCKAPKLSVIDVGDIFRLAHLLGVPKGDEPPPKLLTPEKSLDFYDQFYVNRFADMHMHETLYESR